MHTVQDLFLDWLARVRARIALQKTTNALFRGRESAIRSSLPPSDARVATEVGVLATPKPFAHSVPDLLVSSRISAFPCGSEPGAEMTALELVGIGTPDTPNPTPRRCSCAQRRFSSPVRTSPGMNIANSVGPQPPTAASSAMVHHVTSILPLETPSTTDSHQLTALELVGVGGSPAPPKSPRRVSQSASRIKLRSSTYSPQQPSGTLQMDQDSMDNIEADASCDAIASHGGTEPLTAIELVGTGGPTLVRTLSSSRQLRARSPRKLSRSLSSPQRARSPLKEGQALSSPRLLSSPLSSPRNRQNKAKNMAMNPRAQRDVPLSASGLPDLGLSPNALEEPLSALELVGLGR